VLTTGSHDSIFIFCYLLVIIGAAVILYRRGAIFMAIGGICLLAIIFYLSGKNYVLNLPFILPSAPLKLNEYLYISLIYSIAFFLVAFLSSHLAEQVRDTGELLKQQQIDFGDLEALHQDIVRSLTSGLITADLKGNIQFFNRSACEQTGLMWPSLFGHPLIEIFPALEKVLNEITSGKQNYWRIEQTFTRPDNQKRLFGCSVSPLHNRHKRQNGILLLFQDLTPLKEMEEQARKREKLAAIGEMAAGLAHEIRNPLSSLSGAIQLLRQDYERDDETRILMDIVLRETDRLNRLLTDFLLFARPCKVRKNNHLLTLLLQESLYLFHQDQNNQEIEINLQIPEDCQIYTDPQLFHQVIWNLLINSVQAMEQNRGWIEILVKDSPEGTHISFADNGNGIPAKYRDQIFEPFFSTRDQGTGLGLAVVQRIISDHGGSIRFDDTVSQGACFLLFFPRGDIYPDDQTSLSAT
jgi:two-component system sensor histidine kinase PilS (NtrC family)